jgi:EAL and modified HD-GYP domain-containing signal transduction protein
MRRIHIARQPVLNAARELFGFRLSVRGARGEVIPTPDAEQAQALLRTLTDSSFLRLLGERPIFLDLPIDIVHQPLGDLLPLPGAILTLPAPDSVGAQWLEAAQASRQQGFGIALHGTGGVPLAPDLAKIADYLIAEPTTSPSAPGNSARHLAQGVDTPEDFATAEANGFDLFQGQFFAQPTLFTTDNLSPQQSALLQLFEELAGEADFDAVEATFRRNPELSLQLLQLINSAAFQHGTEVASIRQALVLLGTLQLRRWVGLMLFSQEGQPDWNNPLMHEATLRARIMELSAQMAPPGDASIDWPGSAYITGLLSVVQALLGRPLHVLVRDLGVREEIREALLHRSGPLGELLDAVDRLRRQKGVPDTIPVGTSHLARETLLDLEQQALLED